MSTQQPDGLKAAPPDGFTLLLTTGIAGVQYYDFADGDWPIDAGSPLELRREPDNPHDARAIEIYTLEGRKLGYIPRRRNQILCRLMDAGYELPARLERVQIPPQPDEAPRRRCGNRPRLTAAVFVPTPE